MKKKLTVLTLFIVLVFAAVCFAENENAIFSYDLQQQLDVNVFTKQGTGFVDTANRYNDVTNESTCSIVNETRLGKDADNDEYNYMLETSIYLRSGTAGVRFNMLDDDNYYEITYNTSKAVELSKISGGEKTLLQSATASNSVSWKAIGIRIFYAQAKISAELVYPDGKYDKLFTDVTDSEFAYGKTAICFISAKGFPQTMKAYKLLTVTSDISDKDNASETDDITLNFSYELQEELVNNKNIYIENLQTDTYNILLQNDKMSVIIEFIQPLLFDTNYNIIITKDLSANGCEFGLGFQTSIEFKTRVNPAKAKCDAVSKAVNEISAQGLSEEEKVGKIKQLINENLEVLMLNSDIVTQINFDDVAKDILKRAVNEPFDEQDSAASLTEYIMQRCVVSAYNQSMTELLFDSDYQFLSNDIYNFVDFDTASDLTATDIYENKMSAVTRQKVVDTLMGQEFNEIEDIYREFVKSTVVFGVKYSQNVYDVTQLLEKNGEYAGLDISAYTELKFKNNVNEQLINGEYSNIEQLAEALNLALSNVPETSFEYIFSSNDVITTPWLLTGAGYVFNDEYGLRLESATSVKLLSSFKLGTDINLKMVFKKNYNWCRIIYNYVDDNNYYSIYFSGTDVQAVKKINGTEYTLERVVSPVAANAEMNAELIYASDDRVSFYITSKNMRYTLFENVSCRVSEDGTINEGLFGFEFISASGYLKSISSFNYQSLRDLHINTAEQPVDAEVEIDFVYPYLKSSVTYESIKIRNDDGYVNTDEYVIEFVDDDTLRIKLVKPLKFKTKYYLCLSKSICMQDGKTTMSTDREIGFITEKTELNVCDFYGISGTEKVFSEDMSVTNGEYTANVDISALAGSTVKIYSKADNKGASPKSVTCILTLEGADGFTYYSVKNDLNLTTGSGIDVFNGGLDVFIPQNTADDSKFKLYVLENENTLSLAYPYYDGDRKQALSPDWKINDNIMTISGTAPLKKAARNVNILVLNPDGTVQKFASLDTDENGLYKLEFKINELNGGVTGAYKVLVGGQDFKGAVSPADVVMYGSSETKNNVIDQMNAVLLLNESQDVKQTQIKKLISDNSGILGLPYISYKHSDSIYELSDKDSLAELMILNAPEDGYNQNDSARQFVKILNQMTVLTAYNQALSASLFGENGEFITSDIIDFASIDSDKGLTVYNYYTGSMTDTGKKAVRNYLLQKNVKSVDMLYAEFIKAVVLYGIQNNINGGYGHINSLLTVNGAAAGLDVGEYVSIQNADYADIKILAGKFSTISELNSVIKSAIIVTQNNPGGGNGGASGGGGGTRTGSIIFLSETGSNEEANEAKPRSFHDMPESHWASAAVNYLAARSIVNGDENGYFNPDNAVTREEFVKMAVLGFGLTDYSKTPSFDDVQSGAWYAKYVQIAYSTGIINGKYDSRFGVGDTLSREEAATIVYRALNLENENSLEDIYRFNDYSDISDYAKPAFSALSAKKIINGTTDNMLEPKKKCTRAQVAVIIYNTIRGEYIER